MKCLRVVDKILQIPSFEEFHADRERLLVTEANRNDVLVGKIPQILDFALKLLLELVRLVAVGSGVEECFESNSRTTSRMPDAKLNSAATALSDTALRDLDVEVFVAGYEDVTHGPTCGSDFFATNLKANHLLLLFVVVVDFAQRNAAAVLLELQIRVVAASPDDVFIGKLGWNAPPLSTVVALGPFLWWTAVG